MKNIKIKSLALLLALVMLMGVMVACSETPEETTTEASTLESTSESATESTEKPTEGTDASTAPSTSESEKGSEEDVTDAMGGDSSEAVTEGETTEADTDENTTESETEERVEVTTLPIDGEFAASIVEADYLAGKVNAYFESGIRDKLTVTNDDVILNMGLSADAGGSISSITTKDGKAYLKNTMSAYIRTKDGKVYSTASSTKAMDNNIYRLGYYMYDVHVYGNDFFVDESQYISKYPIGVSSFKNNVGDGRRVQGDDENTFAYEVLSTSDPRAYVDTKFPSAKIKYVKFSLKTTASEAGQLYVMNEADKGNYSSDKAITFEIIPDGEWHEYTIRIGTVPGYTGSVTGLRFDVGSVVGQVVQIKDVVAFNIDGTAPYAQFDRSLYVYSDKINQVMHLINPYDSYDVQEYGWEIKIPEADVEKLIVADRRGEFDTINGVHWGSASYIGFDIKGVGVFGFIMINDELCGTMKVTLEDGNYVIRQYVQVDPDSVVFSKGKEFYLGHRLYFKETHSFDELKFDAYCEMNPLSNIEIIQETHTPMGRFNSYDGLRGAYKYDVRYGNWYNIYTNAQNKQYNIKTTIKGDEFDRKIYVYTSAVGNGQTLECAVLMDSTNTLIPIPLEVCKNFKGDGEENEFLKDIGYSEVYFPLVIKANEEYEFTVAHLYQNWGNFPLKQIDSIQYYTPFYHLSCGVTETNCLRPYYECNEIKNTNNIYALPDHRAMSAPLWIEFKNNDPQHTNGGRHNFLEYFGSDGYITTEFVDDHITSYGPTYAEIVMDYITDDGKIKVSYTHMEMPQTDENRGFYTCTYEFLEDLTITDSKKNFSFYSVAGRYVDYGKIGYLNENNESVVVDNTLKGEAEYLLGDECPYFDCFQWVGGNAETKNDYVNVACLVYNYDVQMGGESFDGGLMIYVQNGWVHLTLNTDTLEFKKGDKISLNMLVIPWGSQLSDYDRVDPDWNIRAVRENTLLDPMTVEVIDGEKVESVYLPTLKTTNGESAEFTLSGGENNVTVEIQGFKKIARPKVYEKIGDEWVVYELSSKDRPDAQGNTNDYDGYMIQYEGGDTFSYSFVVDMNGDAVRTLKIVVE